MKTTYQKSIVNYAKKFDKTAFDIDKKNNIIDKEGKNCSGIAQVKAKEHYEKIFIALLKKYKKIVFKICNKNKIKNVKDYCHDAIMVLIKYHNKYRAKISTFLYIVVLNMIRAECRKNKKHNKTANLTNLNNLFYENKETLDFDDIKNILKNKKVFDIIEKKFKYGMRVADIAKEYKVSKTTIRTSIHSAIKKIRQKMV